MRLQRIGFVLAVLALILTGCGIIAPDAVLEISDGDANVSTVTLSPLEAESVLEVVNTGEMRAHFSVRVQGEWLQLLKQPSAAYLDPEERAAFTIGHACEVPGEYVGSIVVDYEKQIGRWSSFTTQVALECPAHQPVQLRVQRGGYTIPGSLEILVENEEQQGTVELELVNLGTDELEFTIEQPTETWLWKQDRAYGSNSLAGGASQGLILAYQCEGNQPGDATLVIRVHNGTDLVLPVSLAGCPVAPSANPESDLVFKFSDGIPEGSLEFVTTETPTVHLHNIGQVAIEVVLASTNLQRVQIGSSAINRHKIEPNQRLAVPLTFSCDGDIFEAYEEAITVKANNEPTNVKLDLLLTGCKDPEDALVFKNRDGGEIQKINIPYTLGGFATVVELHNSGSADVGVRLHVNDTRVEISSPATGEYILASGAALNISLTPTCDGENAEYSTTIEAWVGNNVKKLLEVNVAGCEVLEDPLTSAELTRFVKNNEPITQLRVTDSASGTIAVGLENLGAEQIGYTLSTTAPWLEILTDNVGAREIPGNSVASLEIGYECPDISTPSAALQATFDDGTLTELPIVLTGCDLDPHDSVRILIDGVEATEVRIHAKAVEEEPSSVTVTLDNLGKNKLTVSIKLQGLSHADWIWPANLSSGEIGVVEGTSQPRELQFECLGGPVAHEAELEIGFPGTNSEPIVVPIRMVGCA